MVGRGVGVQWVHLTPPPPCPFPICSAPLLSPSPPCLLLYTFPFLLPTQPQQQSLQLGATAGGGHPLTTQPAEVAAVRMNAGMEEDGGVLGG